MMKNEMGKISDPFYREILYSGFFGFARVEIKKKYGVHSDM